MKGEKHVSFEINKTSRMLKRYIDKNTHKSYADNLTGTHGWAIGFFYENRDKDVFQRDFEKECNIRRSSATSILKLMEKNGLIVRESVDYDARLKKITLTEKAREIHELVRNDFDALEKKITENLSKEELECFFNVLDKIQKEVECDD